jgi:chaperone BCS1
MTAHQQAALDPRASTDTTLTSRLYRALIPGSHELQARTTESVLPNGKTTAHFTLVPGPGKHLLRYKNTFIGVHRNREGSMPNIQTGEPFETMTLTTLYSHRHIFASIFLEASKLAQAATQGRTMLFVPRMTTWEPFGEPKRKRPLDSVVLATGVKERIVRDIQDFLSARQWYLDRGIPYRRGYLLWGPPGTGKSSFIEALAGHLDFNIAMLTLSERGMTDDRLNVLLNKVPARTIVLLEDADAAFVNRRQVDGEGYSGGTVTFSGLLNALDGVVSAEERIIFLTTNHVERMDAAVVRPGRVDMTVRLGEADEWQVRKMWERFYGESSELVGEPGARGGPEAVGEADAQALGGTTSTLQEAFVQALKQRDMLGKVSTAQLQGLFVMCKDDQHEAIRKIEGLSADMEVAQRAVMG